MLVGSCSFTEAIAPLFMMQVIAARTIYDRLAGKREPGL
jgi:hypothetical protein